MVKLLIAMLVFLAAGLVSADECPAPIKEGAPWTDVDQARLPQMQGACKQRFGDKSCLVRIKKLNDERYLMLCTQPGNN